MKFRVIACLIVCSTQGCGPTSECKHTTGGISQGDTVRTTILGTTPDVYIQQGASCGGLGDLPIGATVTSSATVGVRSELTAVCDDSVRLAPTAVSTGTVGRTNGYVTLRLPNGCTGQISYHFDVLGADPNVSLLATDGGSPAWKFVRTFQPIGDAGGCPPGTSFCMDAFVCENVILP